MVLTNNELYQLVIKPFIPEGIILLVSTVKEPNHFYKYWRNIMAKKSTTSGTDVLLADKENDNMTVADSFEGYTATAVDAPEAVNLVNGEEQEFTIDFSSSNNFPLVPAGKIQARVAKITMKQGSTAPYFNVEYIVAEEGEYLDSKVWQMLSLSPKAAWKIKEFLQAFNMSDEEIAAFRWKKASNGDISNEVFFEPEALVELTIVHEMDTKNNRLQARVNKVSVPSEVEPLF